MMRPYRIAFVVVICVVLIAIGEIVHTQASGLSSFQIPPEMWALLGGLCVTVGINLEQLRRVRLDSKKVADQFDVRCDLDDKWRSDVKVQLARVEEAISYLRKKNV